MIRAQELPLVQDNLSKWLANALQEGSGDDITLGLLYYKSGMGDQMADVTTSEQRGDVKRSEASEQTKRRVQ